MADPQPDDPHRHIYATSTTIATAGGTTSVGRQYAVVAEQSLVVTYCDRWEQFFWLAAPVLCQGAHGVPGETEVGVLEFAADGLPPHTPPPPGLRPAGLRCAATCWVGPTQLPLGNVQAADHAARQVISTQRAHNAKLLWGGSSDGYRVSCERRPGHSGECDAASVRFSPRLLTAPTVCEAARLEYLCQRCVDHPRLVMALAAVTDVSRDAKAALGVLEATLAGPPALAQLVAGLAPGWEQPLEELVPTASRLL